MILITSFLLQKELETKKHVEALAFNRSASSTGETKAIEYIENELNKNNIKSKRQYFQWTGSTRILMRTCYLILIIYLLLFRLILVLAIYYIVKQMSERTRKMTLIKKESSKNIYAHIPAIEREPNRPVVIFSAHYDSVSANIPFKAQVLMFIMYRVIIALYVVIIIVFSAWFTLDFGETLPIPGNLIIIISIVSLFGIGVSIPILYLIFNEKPSSCSIDNASGVAILIELAKAFKKNPLIKIDLYFVWTGAEEWGLKGSKSFCSEYIRSLNNQYDLNKSLNINIDMVGTYIGLIDKAGLKLKRRLNIDYNDLFETTANSLDIPIVRYNKIIEPKSDHKLFKRYAKRIKKNLQIVFFHSDKDSKYIHSLRDTPEKVLPENLNGCLGICYQTLRNIDAEMN
ncbi:MAG: M28 family metallopeptidase [Promethearchaeota archaeon]